MSLSDKARAARERADASIEPADHAVAHALESALDAEAREQLAELQPEPPDPESFPTPAEAGFVSEVWIERGGTEN
jgi:hypothetical protein